METTAVNAQRTIVLGLALLGMVLLAPAAAGAEYLVPPDNSAANQYTESYPTAGGKRNAERDNVGGRRQAGEVLGEDEAQRLQSAGPDGREAAALAAETDPTAAPPSERGDGGGGEDGGDAAGGSGGGSRGAGGDADAEGSSGAGEVVAQATGLSFSGGFGPLLILVLLGALAWALAYLWWDRRASGSLPPDRP